LLLLVLVEMVMGISSLIILGYRLHRDWQSLREKDDTGIIRGLALGFQTPFLVCFKVRYYDLCFNLFALAICGPCSSNFFF
jgi:hypothetical protein